MSGFGYVRIHDCGLERPTSLTWGDEPGQYSCPSHPSPEEPSCRLPKAACSPVTEANAGGDANPGSGVGRVFASSVESLEFTSCLALHLPAFMLGGRWDALGPPPSVFPRLPEDTTVFLFFLLEEICP